MSSLTKVSSLILKDSGWSPERKVDPTYWTDLLKKTDFPIFEALVNVLEKFSGLAITTLPFQEKPFFIEKPCITHHTPHLTRHDSRPLRDSGTRRVECWETCPATIDLWRKSAKIDTIPPAPPLRGFRR